MRALLLALLVALAACAPAAQPPRGDPKLDPLFADLAAAPDAASAGVIEARIWQEWSRSGSATVDILLERAEAAEAAGDKALARGFLDDATALLPSYAEAFNRRAVLAFDADDPIGAIKDIEATLQREPRHFGAWAGLGMIYESVGREDAALRAYREALEIHPFLEQARRGAERLEDATSGQDA